jgi:hypothetical protein
MVRNSFKGAEANTVTIQQTNNQLHILIPKAPTSYLRYLPIVLIAMVFLIGFDLFLQFPGHALSVIERHDAPKWIHVLSGLIYTIPTAVVLLLLSYHVGQPRAGWIAVTLKFLIIAISMWFALHSTGVVGYILNRLFLGVPYVVWLALALRGQSNWWACLPAILIPTGLADFDSNFWYVVEFLTFEVTSGPRTMTVAPLVNIISGVRVIVEFVVLAELYRVVSEGWQNWRMRQITLLSDIKWWQALILYPVFGIFVFNFALGIVSHILMPRQFAEMIADDPNVATMAWATLPVSLMTVLCGWLTMGFVLYCFRRLIVSYSYQKGLAPGVLYWFMQIPVLGWLLFVLGYVIRDDRSLAERATAFERREEDQSTVRKVYRILATIAQLLMLLTIPLILLNKMTENSSILILSAVTLLLDIIYLYYFPTLRALFVLYIINALIWMFGDFDLPRHLEGVTLLALPIFSSAWSYVSQFNIAPMLHMEYFEADEEATPETTEEADDTLLDSFAPDIPTA